MKGKTGRPRSEKSREAIINATHELLQKESGARLTIEAIAKTASVGKPTIYRWWPTLADIVLEAVLHQAESNIKVRPFDSLQETLYEFLKQSTHALTDGGPHLRFLMAQAQQDEAFRKRFRENFVAKRRGVLLSIFTRAIKQEQISSNQNIELLVDIAFGTMWYRLLTDHAPMDESFADELTEIIIRAIH